MKNMFHVNKSPYQRISEPDPYSTYNHVSKGSIQTEEAKKFSETTEPICILADKVYSFCQQRDCFPGFKMNMQRIGDPLRFLGISFQEGYIAEGSLSVTPIGQRKPNFSRIKFMLKIPFTVRLRNTVSGEIISLNGLLPDIKKDIVLFMPETRSEFSYRIVVETRSEIIAPPEIRDEQIELPIGVFSVIKVVGKVQLVIPAYCFNPEPPESESFEEYEEELCQAFDNRPFPDDFFPPQFDDLEIGIKNPDKS